MRCGYTPIYYVFSPNIVNPNASRAWTQLAATILAKLACAFDAMSVSSAYGIDSAAAVLLAVVVKSLLVCVSLTPALIPSGYFTNICSPPKPRPDADLSPLLSSPPLLLLPFLSRFNDPYPVIVQCRQKVLQERHLTAKPALRVKSTLQCTCMKSGNRVLITGMFDKEKSVTM